MGVNKGFSEDFPEDISKYILAFLLGLKSLLGMKSLADFRLVNKTWNQLVNNMTYEYALTKKGKEAYNVLYKESELSAFAFYRKYPEHRVDYTERRWRFYADAPPKITAQIERIMSNSLRFFPGREEKELSKILEKKSDASLLKLFQERNSNIKIVDPLELKLPEIKLLEIKLPEMKLRELKLPEIKFNLSTETTALIQKYQLEEDSATCCSCRIL